MSQRNPVHRVVEVARDVALRVLPGGGDRDERDAPRIPVPVTPPPQLKAVGEKARRAATAVVDRLPTSDEPSEEGQDADATRSGVPYEQWTKAELYERAQELDIEGRSKMTKDELIEALRGT